MRYQEASQGRIFVIRLEHGDIIHKEIEKFAKEKNIKSAALIIVGGIDDGSKLVVGPENGKAVPVTPMDFVIPEAHEITGTGTLFPDSAGEPCLHMHIACGRKDKTVTGCIRKGVKTWHVLEIIMFELLNCNAVRKKDETTGFELLSP